MVLFDPQGRLQANKGRYLGETTNNVAEYQALLLGLEEARRLEVKKLRVLADSELMVKQINGRYRVKAPHLIPLWREALNALKPSGETMIICFTFWLKSARFPGSWSTSNAGLPQKERMDE